MKSTLIATVVGLAMSLSSCTIVENLGDVPASNGFYVSAENVTMFGVAAVLNKKPETVEVFSDVSLKLTELAALDINDPESLKARINEVVDGSSLTASKKLAVKKAFDLVITYYGNRYKEVTFNQEAYSEILMSISSGIDAAIALSVLTDNEALNQD